MLGLDRLAIEKRKAAAAESSRKKAKTDAASLDDSLSTGGLFKGKSRFLLLPEQGF